jgi:hypothetical protein
VERGQKRWTIALVSLVACSVALSIVAIVLIRLIDTRDVSCNFAFGSEDKLTCQAPREPPLPGEFACRMIEHLNRPSHVLSSHSVYRT